MQYFLAVHHGAGAADPACERLPAVDEDLDPVTAELRAAGAWVFTGGLRDPEASTVVDATGDEPVVTDGSVSDPAAYLTGFWVIEAADLDVALTWAVRGSRACSSRIEVRPLRPGTTSAAGA